MRLSRLLWLSIERSSQDNDQVQSFDLSVVAVGILFQQFLASSDL